nr:unnamed protein product [Spirometra erinaceieuropaei]
MVQAEPRLDDVDAKIHPASADHSTARAGARTDTLTWFSPPVEMVARGVAAEQSPATWSHRSVLSNTDLVRAFHQIPIATEDVSTTVVTIRFGFFEFLHTPFGLRNASQTFQSPPFHISILAWRHYLGRMSTESQEEYYPVAVLIEELRNEDVQFRLHSIQKLSTIALALGEEKTRTQLIPFLTDSIYDVDEVMVAIAEQLGDFVRYVGGKDHAPVLIAPLESLALVEDVNVREKAVESLRRLAREHTDRDLQDHIFPLVQRLATGDWYNLSHDTFLSLLADDMAEVRSAAASQIKDFTANLLTSPAPSVAAAPSGESSSSSGNAPLAMDVNRAAEDAPPADSAAGSGGGGGGSNKAGDLPDGNDQQSLPPVTSGAGTAPSGGAAASGDLQNSFVLQKLLPAICDLNADSNVHVKSKLGLAILGLAPILGRDLTINHLLPIILSQLRDESPDVRLNLISNMEEVNTVVGVDHLSNSLLPAIVDLARVPVWRIRMAVINQMPMLAEQLGENFFDENLMQHFFGWLIDAAYAVREAAVFNLTRLTEKFGSEWAKQIFLSEIVKLSHNENYLHRMICLQCIIHLSPVLDSSISKDVLLPTALNMNQDRVPNVRFKVAQALAKIGEAIPTDLVSSDVMPCLQRLTEDPDVDVRFFANQAINSLKGLADGGKNKAASTANSQPMQIDFALASDEAMTTD